MTPNLCYGRPMTTSPQPEPAYMTPREAADLLRVEPSTLKTWRRREQGPPFVRLGNRTIRYERRAVATWLEQDEVRA